MSLLNSFVVAHIGDAKGDASVLYLTRRGKHMDHAQAVQGARDWQPALSGDVEYFTDRDGKDGKQLAREAAATWGGSPIEYGLALRYEAIRAEGWTKLETPDQDYPGMGL